MTATRAHTGGPGGAGRAAGFRARLRALLGLVLSVALVAAGIVVLPVAQPPAEAATTTDFAYGSCSYRQSSATADTYRLANQLCWLDMTSLPVSYASPGAPATMKVGRYTLSFTTTIVQGDSTYLSYARDPLTSTSLFGNRMSDGSLSLMPYAGDTRSPLLRVNHASIAAPTLMRMRLSNIVLTDETGARVTDFRLGVVEGEMTTLNEGISLDDVRAGDSISMSRITPTIPAPGGASYMDACLGANQGAPATEYSTLIAPSQRLPRDFVCEEVARYGRIPAMFVASAQSPTTLTISTYSDGYQGFALAIPMGRLGGSVTSQTTYESAATGQATTFDFTMASRVGTTETAIPRLPDGSIQTYLRPMADDLMTPRDLMTFRSTASGVDAARVFDRYSPVWTCTAGSNAPVVIRTAGSTQVTTAPGYTDTYTVTNSGTSSTLTSTNLTDAALDCDVHWEPKYAPATFDLAKTVDGTAANFTEVQLRQFTLAYECVAPAGHDAAYPGVPMTGSVTLQKGQTATASMLPVGARCTVHEEFPDGAPPARPGKSLDLTWSTGTVAAGSPLPTTTVTLEPRTSLTANNRYDYRAGSIVLSKELVGDAVPELVGTSRTYDFELTCEGTTVQNRRVSLTLTRGADGVAGSTTIDDVPVARDCALTPLSGLTAEESERFVFEGRDVLVDGTPTPLGADEAYHVTLADYAAGATPTVSTVDITAHYTYKLRDLSVVKHLSGAAAGSSELAGALFPVQYVCTWGTADAPQSRSGSLQITTDQANPALVEDLPVGATCRVWEEGTPPGERVELTGTEVSFSDRDDVVITLTNDEARTTPVATVEDVDGATQNRVLVDNAYAPRVGAVTLTKEVVDNGLLARLPEDYELSFTCGARSVERADGSVVSVPLSGRLRLGDGDSGVLVADVADPALAALVNDRPDGALGVPYGNECDFQESAPDANLSGIVWSTDAEDASVVIGSDTTAVTVTNTFTPAGQGLTLSQRVTSHPELAEPVTYTLTCRDPGGSVIALPAEHATVVLDDGTPTHVIPANVLPEGSTCEVREVNVDDGTRTAASGDPYPITRTSTAFAAADGEAGAVDLTFAPAGTGPDEELTGVLVPQVHVGDATVLELTHAYDFHTASVSAGKEVAFDPATERYISEARKEVKRTRDFPIALVCQDPTGEESVNVAGQVSAATGALVVEGVAVGSTCVTAEGATSTAEGIEVTQEVRVDGAAPVTGAAFFVVDADGADVTFVNTYARRLASVELSKIADLPAAVEGQYAAAGQEIPFHTHTFVMECRDPETADSAVLGTFTGTITGPGGLTFDGVPVGAQCAIVGDHFGALDLALTDPSDGVELEAHLAPSQVTWVVDGNDGDTFVDTDFPGDVTESGTFRVRDAQNTVDLVNTYAYETTPITLTKQVTGTEAGLALLDPAQEYSFLYQCKGVGYQTSTIGEGETLPSAVALADFGPAVDNGDGTFTRTFTSGQVEVPAGAWCTFTEAEPAGTPAQLTHTFANGATIAGRTSSPEASGLASWDFSNVYARRMVPVRLSVMHEGYLTGADAAGYVVDLVCDDPAGTTSTHTVPLDQANSVATVADGTAPASGVVVDLPTGAECTMTLADSPALQARPEVEVTDGDRAPFVLFGVWREGAADESNPDVAPGDITPQDVTAQMKTFATSFTVAADAAVPDGSDVAMTVGAEAVAIRDTVDVTLTKQSEGEVATGAEFTLESSCLPAGSATLSAGDSVLLPGVPVDSDCYVLETDDGVEGSEAQLAFDQAGTGDRITPGEVVNLLPGTELSDGTVQETSVHSASFTALPVVAAEDLSTDGPAWAVTLVNRFPAVQVTKSIEGGPLSVLGALADTAVLPSGATSMDVTYTVRNTGAQTLGTLALADPSLAGRTLTRDGATWVVAEDGTIDPAACGLDGATLAAGESLECTVSVALEDASAGFLEVRGPVTVTADAEGAVVTDTADYGAIRPVLGELPQTGVRALVLVLLAGMLTLAYGLWRRRRDARGED